MITVNEYKIFFAILSTLVGLAAFLPYLRDMFRGSTTPHSYTWLIWTITQGTAVAGLWYGNGGIGALSISVGTFFVCFIFLLSLKRGTTDITFTDTLVLLAALSAIIVWWQLHNPLLAVLMVSAIDALGYIPTFRKSFAEPWSETVSGWFLFAAADGLSIVALNEYNFLTVTYLATLTVVNTILIVFLLARRAFVSRPKQATLS